MAESGSFRDEVRLLLRERLLDAAREITTEHGWSALTMSSVAGRVGISRQHLYNEVGTKQELGDAMIERETDEFLDHIREQLRRHPDDPVAGVAAAARVSLQLGARNALLKAILTTEDPRGESLLPLLTAQPEAVLRRVSTALRCQFAELHADFGADENDTAVCLDGVVRLVLSHLTQSNGPDDHVVRQVQWLVRGLAATGDVEAP